MANVGRQSIEKLVLLFKHLVSGGADAFAQVNPDFFSLRIPVALISLLGSFWVVSGLSSYCMWLP